MIEIIEIDQWTSSGDFTHIPFDDLDLDLIFGGDSAAAKAIFGGTFKRKNVMECDYPGIGNVWLIKDEQGFPKVWKTNYDSSD